MAGEAVRDGTSEGYPRMLYHPDGRTQVVTKREDEQALEGFQRQPSQVHQRPSATGVGSVMASGNDPMALLLREVIEAVLDERGVGSSRAERAERRQQARPSGFAPPAAAETAQPQPAAPEEPPALEETETETARPDRSRRSR